MVWHWSLWLRKNLQLLLLLLLLLHLLLLLLLQLALCPERRLQRTRAQNPLSLPLPLLSALRSALATAL